MKDFIALIVTFTVSVLWLRIVDFAAHRGWIESRLSRKIIHIGTGPLFVVCWLLFSPAPIARYLAALVPGMIIVQFFLVGIGKMQDPAAVQAMSRTGDPREILRGPLYYGIVFVVLTICYWLETPIGIVALMLLCGGDGFADILGRRFGRRKLPWNRGKSWMGSLGFLTGAWLLAVIVMGVFIAADAFPGPFIDYIPAISLIALVGTIVESISPVDSDNLTVPIVAVLMGYLLF